MKNHYYCLLLILLNFFFLQLTAKEKGLKKVSIEDFQTKLNPEDKGYIFFNNCDVSFVGNNTGWVSVKYTFEKRFLIANRTALDEANLAFKLFNNNVDKDNFKIIASTYNLIEGKIIETELSKDQKFKEKVNKLFRTIKCQMPNVKEGSIIDYKVEIISPFYQNISPFTFQSHVFPTASSSYSIAVPEFLDYVNLTRGSVLYDTVLSSKSADYFRIRNVNDIWGGRGSVLIELTADVFQKTYIMKNLPAFSEDELIYSLSNILPSSRFQLSRISIKGQPVKKVLQDWTYIYNLLKEDNYFGKELKDKYNWKKETKLALKAKSPLENAQTIYNYVKANMSYTQVEEIQLNHKLDENFKNKSGNCADINMLLVSMLRNADINAKPAIVSTRENGYPVESYPFITDFNYLIAVVEIESQYYFLDATDPDLCFGLLPLSCYNGAIMVYNEQAESMTKLFLPPDLIEDEKLIINKFKIEKDLSLKGTYDATYGLLAGYSIRKNLHNASYKEKFASIISSKANTSIVVENSHFKNEDSSDNLLNYQLDYHTTLKANNKLIYLNPFWIPKLHENLFKNVKRLTMIELPSKVKYKYQTFIDFPENLTVVELPENILISYLNDNLLVETIFVNLGKQIKMEFSITIATTLFANDHYPDVKKFFSELNKKSNPTVILKQND